MAEGTELRDLREHTTTLEERMQILTTEYQGRVKEVANQIIEVRDNAIRYEEL